MAIENHFIHYTTLYLSRREEILIHSIIALYSSKNGFKWINSNNSTGHDIAVVMIGSDIKNLDLSKTDPFANVKMEQVICVLGEFFYPKNARAVVHVDLPIKALQLVDILSEIEKKYIQKDYALGYIASKQLAKSSLSKKIASEPAHRESLLNRNGTIDFVPTKVEFAQVGEVGFNNKNDEREGVMSHLELFKTLDLQLESKAEESNEPKPFALELVDSLDGHKVTEPKKVISLKPDNFMGDSGNNAREKTNTTFTSVSESVNLKEEIRLVPPTLTEVVSDMSGMLVKKVVADKQVDNTLAPNLAPKDEVVQKEVKEKAQNINSVIEKKTVDEENIEVPLTEKKLTQEEGEGPRIKLLRWPKADLIQQHPGNAILASMVINTPMSVYDMATQSDLPVSICQRFFNAVVTASVAEYVDQEKSVSEPVEEQQVVNEDIPKKKGILYRIRVALGLVRK